MWQAEKLANVIPRLAIVRANCNGSLPSGEPSSNPEQIARPLSEKKIKHICFKKNGNTDHPHILQYHVAAHRR